MSAPTCSTCKGATGAFVNVRGQALRWQDCEGCGGTGVKRRTRVTGRGWAVLAVVLITMPLLGANVESEWFCRTPLGPQIAQCVR